MLAMPAVVRDSIRLTILRQTGLVDSPEEEAFDRLSRLAAEVLEVPIALICLVDRERVFVKSAQGLPEPWRTTHEIPFSHAACQYAIAGGEPLAIEDVASHPATRDGSIAELGVAAYLGTPIVLADAYALGTLCVMDHAPHPWSPTEKRLLRELAAAVAEEMGWHRMQQIWRRRESSLRVREERNRLLARATDDVIRDWSVRDGAVEWNEGSHRVLRYAPTEMGSSLEWWIDRLHPEDREPIANGLHVAVNGVAERWTAEYRFRRGDGSYATVLDRACLARNERGEPTRMVSVMFDVTERKRAEEAQRFLARAGEILDASLDYEITFNSLAHLAVPTLADYCLIDIVEEDTARRVATAHADPSRTRLLYTEARHRLDEDPEQHPVLRVLQNGQSILVPEVTEEVRRQLGHDPEHEKRLREIGLRSYMIVPMIAHGRTLGAITLAAAESGRSYKTMDLLLAEDLARRAALAVDNGRLYREAQTAVRAREEVLNVVSHDLRNPLNAIYMGSMLLLEDTDDRRSGSRKVLQRIRNAAEQMERMIRDLLDLSSIEAGRLSLEPRPHSPIRILEDANDLLEPITSNRSIRLQVQVANDLPDVLVDRDRTLQVLSNLVGNAVKYTPRQGTIHLSASIHGEGAVCFSVQDTGPGIAPEHLPHLFDRYWQIQRSGDGSVGLGLAIVKGIVEAQGGAVWAESRVGEGSTFAFTVPVAPPAEAGEGTIRPPS